MKWLSTCADPEQCSCPIVGLQESGCDVAADDDEVRGAPQSLMAVCAALPEAAGSETRACLPPTRATATYARDQCPVVKSLTFQFLIAFPETERCLPSSLSSRFPRPDPLGRPRCCLASWFESLGRPYKHLQAVQCDQWRAGPVGRGRCWAPWVVQATLTPSYLPAASLVLTAVLRGRTLTVDP